MTDEEEKMGWREQFERYQEFIERVNKPWLDTDYYEKKVVGEKITISELKNNLNESQIAAIIKRPFWFKEIEEERKEDYYWHEIKTVTRVSNDRNTVVRFEIYPDFSKPDINVLVKYIHYVYDSGGDGIPAMYNQHSCTYYFKINEKGEVSEDYETRNMASTNEYISIDFELK